MEDLSKLERRALGVAMAEQLAALGIDVCKTRFGKQLGAGLFEFRVDEDIASILNKSKPPSEPLCFRLFCHAHGRKRILLLGGYDKGQDSSKKRQDREIKLARARLADWRKRHEDVRR